MSLRLWAYGEPCCFGKQQCEERLQNWSQVSKSLPKNALSIAKFQSLISHESALTMKFKRQHVFLIPSIFYGDFYLVVFSAGIFLSPSCPIGLLKRKYPYQYITDSIQTRIALFSMPALLLHITKSEWTVFPISLVETLSPWSAVTGQKLWTCLHWRAKQDHLCELNNVKSKRKPTFTRWEADGIFFFGLYENLI